MYGIATLQKVLENKEICLSGRCYNSSADDALSEKIYKLRKRKHLSRNKFADMVGVNVLSVRGWEYGTTIPTKASLEKVCGAFGLDIAYFI